LPRIPQKQFFLLPRRRRQVMQKRLAEDDLSESRSWREVKKWSEKHRRFPEWNVRFQQKSFQNFARPLASFKLFTPN